MWTRAASLSSDARTETSTLRRDGAVATRAEVLAGWRDDDDFRLFFSAELARAPWAAFLWETPAWSRPTMDAPFECVTIASDVLAQMPVDRRSFADPMRRARERDPDATVCTFENLGGDATLVLPLAGPNADYPHLAAFVRDAPAGSLHAFWRGVARAVHARLDDRPFWLSTSGLGVAWLHARLDERPKYFQHAAYR